MKHAGPDNFLLYSLCAVATRAESLVKFGAHLMMKAGLAVARFGRSAKPTPLQQSTTGEIHTPRPEKRPKNRFAEQQS